MTYAGSTESSTSEQHDAPNYQPVQRSIARTCTVLRMHLTGATQVRTLTLANFDRSCHVTEVPNKGNIVIRVTGSFHTHTS